jgi:hypothetical protein
MTAAIARYDDVAGFDARFDASELVSLGRRILNHITLSLAATATVGLVGAGTMLTAAWIVTSAMSGGAYGPVKASVGEGTFAGTHLVMLSDTGARERLASARRASDMTLEARVARARALATELAAAVPPAPLRPMEIAAASQVLPLPRPEMRADIVPIPRPAPVRPEVAELAPPQEPVAPAAVAAIPIPTPAPEPKIVAAPPQPEPAAPKLAALPPHTDTKKLEIDDRTAVYDISARTVYMPNGQRLEAHSGLGDKMDDPRHVHVRMRGATPPNVYKLTLREQLFHGVRAIRLNPLDERKMFGRDGILAHTYMLGPSGQSNGCVSFRDYDKFLRAFLNGDVDRLVVVSSLDGAPPSHVARAGRTRSVYASADAADIDRAKGTW